MLDQGGAIRALESLARFYTNPQNWERAHIFLVEAYEHWGYFCLKRYSPTVGDVNRFLQETRWRCLPICHKEHFSLAIFDQGEQVWFHYDSGFEAQRFRELPL